MSHECTLPKTPLYPEKRSWPVETLWDLASTLEVFYMDVQEIYEEYRKIDCWLQGEDFNTGFVMDHMSRILEANLDYPIIFSEEDYIMDGVHRLCKAAFYKQKTIKAVKFQIDPKT